MGERRLVSESKAGARPQVVAFEGEREFVVGGRGVWTVELAARSRTGLIGGPATLVLAD